MNLLQVSEKEECIRSYIIRKTLLKSWKKWKSQAAWKFPLMITYKSAHKFSNKMFNNITYQKKKKKKFNNIDRRNENKNERTQ